MVVTRERLEVSVAYLYKLPDAVPRSAIVPFGLNPIPVKDIPAADGTMFILPVPEYVIRPFDPAIIA